MRQEDLTIFHECMKRPVFQEMVRLQNTERADEKEKAATALVRLLIVQAEKHGLRGPVLEQQLWHGLLCDVNPFSLECEHGVVPAAESSLFRACVRDFRLLREAYDKAIGQLHGLGLDDFVLRYIPSAQAASESPEGRHTAILMKLTAEKGFSSAESDEARVSAIAELYRRYGCGNLAMFPMLRWKENAGIVGIENYDPVRLTDLAGYRFQREALLQNTQAFLQGKNANNVLLAGAPGTGKSSLVKALANEFFEEGLRLLEVGKDQLEDLPQMLKATAARGKKFLLFIDDLSFEDFEVDYKYIKSLLEGSVEKKPDNVLFYATSNRRHIIQQKWKDRQASDYDQEVHGLEAMNEKLSLSQRFGLTLTFTAPSQPEYLTIVHHIAAQEGILPKEEAVFSGTMTEFDKEAVRWSMEQKGFSGRTARQFILHYLQEH